jgi:hypothetical protein
VIIADSNPSSALGNRILTGKGDVTIVGTGSATFVYWNNFWRLVSISD